MLHHQNMNQPKDPYLLTAYLAERKQADKEFEEYHIDVTDWLMVDQPESFAKNAKSICVKSKNISECDCKIRLNGI